MQLKTIVSSASAAALMVGMGVAAAGPVQQQTGSAYQQSGGYHSNQSRSYQHQDMTTQVASEAAMVLRNSSQAGQTQQSNPAQRYTGNPSMASQQIPQQVANSARCIAVFPNVSETGTATGSAGMSNSGMHTSGSAGTMTASTMDTGLASCRNDNGQWSQAPVVVKLSSAKIQSTGGMQSGMTGGTTGASGSTEATGTTGMTGTTGTAGTTGTMGRTSASGTAGTTGTSGSIGRTGTTGMAGANTGTAMNQSNGKAVVLLFTSEDAADTLQGGDVELGDDVKVAPGPTGSTAMTSSNSEASVVAYQTSPQGGVSGASVQSGKISFDQQANEQTYGNDADPEDLLQGNVEQQNMQKANKLSSFNQALNQFAPATSYRGNGGNGGR